MAVAASVEDYFAAFPLEVREVLDSVRATIRSVLPDAEETISYQIPTFRVGGKSVVHLAGWKAHISLYPVPAGDEAWTSRIAPFVAGKGTAKFKLNEPIPHDVIREIVERLLEQRSR